MEKDYILPVPVLNKKEKKALDVLTNRYKKMIEPSVVSKVSQKAKDIAPPKIKDTVSSVLSSISENDLYQRALELASSGFKIVEEQVAKYTINESMIIKEINKFDESNKISKLQEICLFRSYDISRAVNKSKGMSRTYAFVEGGATGAVGFWGLPFNLVLSTLLYFRAVQTIAMYYGYDVRSDASELIISSEVFINALSPSKTDINNEMGGIIGKVMLMTQASVVRQTAKKTWFDMASKGGIPLLLAQMRALANKAAQKAIEKAGEKGLERSIFKSVFEQIGKKLTLKTVGKAVPVASAILGGLIDIALMHRVVEFADIFYQKRFILEKESRIDQLLDNDSQVIDVDFIEK